VSNTSVNPARSTGPALFAGTEPLTQLWAFWLAPLVGAAIAGVVYTALLSRATPAAPLEETTEA
jgi:aquaporin Z